MLVPRSIAPIVIAVLGTAAGSIKSSNTATSVANTNMEALVSDDGSCGAWTAGSLDSGSNRTCSGRVFGRSCSRRGRCGDGHEHYGPGCQLEFSESCGVPYTRFIGDGGLIGGSDPDTYWPLKNLWITLDDMVAMNRKVMLESCAQYSVESNNDTDINNLRDMIMEVSHDKMVDATFILAIVLQESQGCVRRPNATSKEGLSTLNGVLLGKGTAKCEGLAACQRSTIREMLENGGSGVPESDLRSLVAAIEKNTDHNPQHSLNYYRAAYVYSTAVANIPARFEDAIPRHCYVSDVANRLVGWVGHNSTGYCDDSGSSGATGSTSSTMSDSNTASGTSSLPSHSSLATTTSSSDSLSSTTSSEKTVFTTITSTTTLQPFAHRSSTLDHRAPYWGSHRVQVSQA